jgi:hypothetical protein
MLFLAEHNRSRGESATAIRRTLDDALMMRFSIDLTELQNSFCFVTDWANTMPNIVGASTSRSRGPLTLSWSGCSAHQLSTVLRAAFDETKLVEADVQELKEDLCAMRTIIRIFKQSDLNSLLPDGEALFPEVETRFHHLHDVSERFLKSAESVSHIFLQQGSENLREAFECLAVESIDGRTSYPNFSALRSVMAPFADGIKKLQASSVPTIHLVLPFYRHLRTLLTYRVHRISVMTSISRMDRVAGVLSARALRMMNSKLIVHPLHIAALLLHPLFRTLSSLYHDEQERERAKSEGLEILKAAARQNRLRLQPHREFRHQIPWQALREEPVLTLILPHAASTIVHFPWRICLKSQSCIQSARLRTSYSGISVQLYLILTGLFCYQTTNLGLSSFGSARNLYFHA